MIYTITAKNTFSYFGVMKKTLYIEYFLHHYTKRPVKFEKNAILGVMKKVIL